MENSRPTYGWAIEERCGELWFQIFSTRKEAIKYAEDFLGKDWRTIRRRLGFSIVKVELVKSDWTW